MHQNTIDVSEEAVFRCDECQTGIMHLQHITYFTWLNDELITVPNFPAWVCDVCGRRIYDEHAITVLNTLLNPEAGRKPKIHKKPSQQRPNQPRSSQKTG